MTTRDNFSLQQYIQDFSRAWQVQNFELPGTTWQYMQPSELFPGYLAPVAPTRIDKLSTRLELLQNSESERQLVLGSIYSRYSPPNLQINLNRPFW